MTRKTDDQRLARVLQEATGQPYQTCLIAATGLRPLITRAGADPIARALTADRAAPRAGTSSRPRSGPRPARPGAQAGPPVTTTWELNPLALDELGDHWALDGQWRLDFGQPGLVAAATSDESDPGATLVLPLLPTAGMPPGCELVLETWVELLKAPCPLGSFDLFTFVHGANTAPREGDWVVFDLEVTPVPDAAYLPPPRPLDDPLRCFDLPDYEEEPVDLDAPGDWAWQVYPGTPSSLYALFGPDEADEQLGQDPPVSIPAGLLEARDAHLWESAAYPQTTARAGDAGGPCYYVLDDERTRRRWWGATCDTLWSTVWLAGPPWPGSAS